MYRASALILLAAWAFASPGLASTVWSIGTTSTGHNWIAPTGQTPASLCKITGLDDVVYSTQNSVSNGAVSKYASVNAFSNAMSTWMSNTGFNFVASDEFFQGYVNNYAQGATFPSGNIPYTPQSEWSSYATRGSPPFGLTQVKQLNLGFGSTAICGASIGLGVQVDPYDPNIQTDFNDLAGGACPTSCAGEELPASISNGNGPHVVYFLPEEADSMAGLDSWHTHPDGGYILAADNPSITTWTGTGDDTLFAKTVGYRDVLLNEYFCTGSGTPLACCTANQKGTCTAGTGTTLSGGQLSTALTALNTAWGLTGSTACTGVTSHLCNGAYTTWNTSDAGGLAGIVSGTYASWGTGTGVLDENGKRIISSGAAGTCNVDGDQSWAANTTILNDISGGTAHTGTVSVNWAYADKYGSVLQTAIGSHGVVNPMPPTFVPIYDGPPNVYNALMPHMRAIGGGIWFSLGATGQSGPTDLTDPISWIANTTDPVFIGADFFKGNCSNSSGAGCAVNGSDSPYAPFWSNTWMYIDQHPRGQAMVSFLQALLALKDSSGHYPIIGYEHVYLYDKPQEPSNYGLRDSASDNPMDGSLSTNATASACAGSTLYTGPAICTNGGSTYGIWLASGATCTSGTLGSFPSLTFGQTGVWGACTIYDDGSATHIAETSTQAGCSGHASVYGNCSAGGVILPVKAFLTGFNVDGTVNNWTDANGVVRTGFCDPAGPPPNGTGGATVGMW